MSVMGCMRNLPTTKKNDLTVRCLNEYKVFSKEITMTHMTPITVVPVMRSAIVKKNLTLKVGNSFAEVTEMVIDKGTVVEAGTSFYPGGRRTMHTRIVHEGQDINVPTSSLQFMNLKSFQ